jgi:diketogulonate reductase-like aldo/keto reductase
MKGGVEYAFVARELMVRTGRQLVVLTLPLVCWLAGQDNPGQMLLAWAVQRGTALLTTPRTAARARENFDSPYLAEGALDEINRIQTRQRLKDIVKVGIPGFIPKGA